MYKILIVEDDDIISSIVEKKLNSWGYNSKRIQDFSNVLEEFEEFKPDLVLLDIYLPFYNGYHYCQKIREKSDVPVIFVSSASDNMNIIMAMNMLADDFVVKPFDIDVLIAKVKAILRRTYENRKVNVLTCKDVSLNLNDASIIYNGKKLELTKNDYKILTVLFENTNTIVSREKIMTYLWETDEFIDDNTLTVNITRLRKKLENFGIIDFIKTKKGMGYYI